MLGYSFIFIDLVLAGDDPSFPMKIHRAWLPYGTVVACEKVEGED
jgi:hypothetical protein